MSRGEFAIPSRVDQNVGTREKRRDDRHATAWPVVIRDDQGDLMAKGRSANLSETGAMVIVSRLDSVRLDDLLILEIDMAPAHEKNRRPQWVRQHCRVARVQVLGNLMGLGLEFILPA